nr:agamous-like MADS-box protein AGL80 [Ipomoea batatas]
MQAVVKKRKIERRKEALFKKAEEISVLCGSEIGIMTMQAVVKKRKIERRKEALFKKADEISVLCGSEIGIVIVSPTERDPIIWPEVEAMTNIFSAFMEVPEEERVKRMVLHKEYMRVKVIAGRRNLTEMDARQLKGLYALADDKMVELEKRKQDFPATADDGGAARPPRRREWNLAPVAADSGGADGGGSYYVPQPPAPAAGELLPATWYHALGNGSHCVLICAFHFALKMNRIKIIFSEGIICMLYLDRPSRLKSYSTFHDLNHKSKRVAFALKPPKAKRGDSPIRLAWATRSYMKYAPLFFALFGQMRRMPRSVAILPTRENLSLSPPVCASPSSPTHHPPPSELRDIHHPPSPVER